MHYAGISCAEQPRTIEELTEPDVALSILPLTGYPADNDYARPYLGSPAFAPQRQFMVLLGAHCCAAPILILCEHHDRPDIILQAKFKKPCKVHVQVLFIIAFKSIAQLLVSQLRVILAPKSLRNAR